MGQFPNPNTKWKPGQSGNPSGYSRGRRQIDDMIDMIEETAGAERAISRSWLKQVLAGSYPHLREYLERRDGKVPTPVEAIETPTVDWSELNVDRDTERPKAAKRVSLVA
jgi:hypothetical protein